jgi:tetratricopeptide (TPR) repeat protein
VVPAARFLLLPLAVAALAANLSAARAAPAASGDDPDALYRQRENLELAIRAADVWKARLSASPRDFDVACKLARARLYIGEMLPRQQRAPHLKEGVAAARIAVALEPRRPDGYFWLGANMGSLAGASNVFTALRYRSPVREAFEAALARDPAFLRGGAFCTLGKYYNAVPGLFGGSKRKSEDLLRRCLAHDPGSTVGHYYLGQTLIALGRTAEARAALQAAIDAPPDPEYVPEGRVWKGRAQRLLARLNGTAR